MKEDNQQNNHDEKMTSNFCGYCKEKFKKNMNLNQILIEKRVKRI